MKKIDLVIWVLVGFALFLIWSRFVSTYTNTDLEYIQKARDMFRAGKSDVDVEVEFVKGGMDTKWAVKLIQQARSPM
jgi:hypothetical protein